MQALRSTKSEAIAMSLEWPADLLIMDESSGRALARSLNISITGTLGMLLKAKRDGEIPSWKSKD
jgi:predicted nucleic acid-binding protein